MKERESEDKPRQTLTTQNYKEQNWYDSSHNDLVKAFRDYVEQPKPQYLSRAEVIRLKLRWKEGSPNKIKKEFWYMIRSAWDALAYDYYEPGTEDERMAGSALQNYYQRTHESTIKLSDPVQVRTIDALLDTIGIPHKKGQTQIEIPKKLKNYNIYQLSKEYQERLAKAKSELLQRQSQH
jgi:hypothetical protein